MKFGCILPQRSSDFSIIREVALECERLGFDSIWTNDHLYPYEGPVSGPFYDAWTPLCALATVTSKIRLGPFVLVDSFRYPSIVAKETSALDQVSGGRVEVGLGAGWWKEEFDAYGIPFIDAETRIAALREGIQIIKKMWTEEKTTFRGKYHSVESVYNNPKPVQKPHPPLWVAGADRRVMKVAAEFADVWDLGFYPSNTPEGYRKKVKALERCCRDIGRNPDGLCKSWHGEIVIAGTESELRRRVAQLRTAGGLQAGEPIDVARIIGTPDQCAKQIERLAEYGASYIMIRFDEMEKIEPLKLFAEEVMPRFRGT
jgi:probable F420-dependent oxidoreductase